MPVLPLQAQTGTLADWCNEARRYLFTMQREELNLLTSTFTSQPSPTTFTVPFVNTAKSITPGSVLAIDLELFYVFSVAGNVATVIGGWLGSTPTTHQSGAIITVNPKFPDFTIAYAINQELISLSSPDNGLFQIKDVEITFNPVVAGYDLTDANSGLPVTSVIDIQSVRYKQGSASQYEPAIARWRLDRNQTDALYPSGYTLSIYESGWPGLPIHVHYRAPFTTLANLTDTAGSTGLPTTAYDLPPLGAAIRLMAGREIKRNFTEAQDEPKRAQEVPPGAIAASVKPLMMLWQRRVFEEASRLEAAYPRLTPRF